MDVFSNNFDLNGILKKIGFGANNFAEEMFEQIDNGNYSYALNQITNEIYSSPDNSALFFLRALAREGLGDLKGTISDLDFAINFGYNDEFLDHYYFSRANLKYRLKNYKDAINDYSAAIHLNPLCAEYFCNRGMVYTDLNDHEGACQDLDVAINLEPSNSMHYIQRGIAKCAKGNLQDFKDIINDFNAAIRLEPNNANYYYVRGLYKEDGADLNGARNDLKKALKIDPLNKEFIEDLNRLEEL